MPSFLIRFVSVIAVLVTVSATGEAQGLGPQRAQPMPQMVQPGLQPGMAYPQERMSVVDPDKKLSAGDQVTFEILEDREGGFPRVVTATGELDVPPIGRVRVTGKTAPEAAAAIKQLLERDYYYTATVRLSIDQVSKVQVQAGIVQVSGQVRAQGQIFIVAGETLTVTGAILKSGGIGEWGNQKAIKLMRPRKDGTTETTEINFKKITETGDVKSDPVLQDGDRIFVPKVGIRF